MGPGEWSAGVVIAALAVAATLGYLVGAQDFGCVAAGTGCFVTGFTTALCLATWGM